ncbi:MAG: hypothetical protein JO031_02275 [Ktedonobacteraceae bacterium]|nr:hypothetical protein [Ktedonobacteraceae bacterium]
MSRRITLISLLVILVIVGLISGFFTGSIQKALSTPVAQMMDDMVKGPPTQVPAAPPAAKPGQMTAPPGAMQTGNVGNTLAQDSFQRQNQRLWGTASDGRMWEGDANKANAFSIANNAGQIANAQGTLNALLGLPGTNMEATLSGSLNHFNNGKVNLGAVLRWADDNDWYKVLIDGAHVSMLKRVHGVTTTLATVPFQAQGGKMYSLRFRAIGAMLFARAWPTGSPEPQNWMLNVTDTTLTTGQAGVRVLMQGQSVVNITTFSVIPATLGNTA